jgi:hypothetical protein
MASEIFVSPLIDIAGISAEDIATLITEPCGEPYWKDRLYGHCRDIFFITTLDRIPQFLDAMNAEAKRYHFPENNLGVYIQPIQQGRNCHLEFNLMFDGSSAIEADRVRVLFESASRVFAEMGAFFSRPYGTWADLVYRKDPHTVKALKMVKNMLDPGNVMNPGKLCFEREV